MKKLTFLYHSLALMTMEIIAQTRILWNNLKRRVTDTLNE